MAHIIEVEAPQGSPQWREARSELITGSRVGALLGMSPFTTRDALMKEMIAESLGNYKDISSPPMTWGTDNEAAAVLEATLEAGVVFESGGFFTNSDYNGVGYSPDGYNRTAGLLLECKCPYGLRNDPEPAFKQLADLPHYWHQMQLGMLVMDLERCAFFQWTPNGSQLDMVDRDPNYWLELKQHILDFDQDFNYAVNDPEYMEALLERNDHAFNEAAARYKAALHNVDFAKGRLEDARQELIDLAPQGGFNSQVRISKVAGKKTTNWQGIAKDNLVLEDLDLEQYEKTGADSYRINVVKEK